MFVLSVYWWLKTGSFWFLHQKCVTTYWKRVNKVSIWILNCHIKNKCKFEAFWFVFKSFCYTIFINFRKKLVVGGDRKEPKMLLRGSTRVAIVPHLQTIAKQWSTRSSCGFKVTCSRSQMSHSERMNSLIFEWELFPSPNPPPYIHTFLDDIVLAINLLSIEFPMKYFTQFQKKCF